MSEDGSDVVLVVAIVVAVVVALAECFVLGVVGLVAFVDVVLWMGSS